MLREIFVRNYALLNDVRVVFDSGLNVLTGETGAGKTILIKALSFLLGEKGNVDDIREGEDEAIVVGTFSMPKEVKLLINSLGIETEDEIIIRRILKRDGRGNIYINDIRSTVKTLQEIGKYLIDIHGQHKHQLLLNENTHIDFIDSFGELLEQRKNFKTNFYSYLDNKNNLEALISEADDLKKKRELLQYQIEELEKAELKEGEEQELLKDKEILTNFEKIAEGIKIAMGNLETEEMGILKSLGEVVRALKKIASYDNKIKEFAKTSEDALSILQDLNYSLMDYSNSLNYDPERLNFIMERLSLIQDLQKKYNMDIKDLIAYKEKIKNEINRVENIDNIVEKKRREVEEMKARLYKSAEKLSEERKNISHKFRESVKQELSKLGFKNADFVVDIKRKDIDDTGIDSIQFLIAPNPGEGVKPLKNIASGGELSRIMLALKTILSDVDRVGGIVFDEIDVGIGGRTAEVIGRKMKEIGKKRQVICITHLPAIAAFGDSHLVVEKKIIGKRTITTINKAEGEERVKEIARMLGGQRITDAVLSHARELLKIKN